MNSDFLAQMAMQLQDPQAIAQVSTSPYDPWAIMSALDIKLKQPMSYTGVPIEQAPAPVENRSRPMSPPSQPQNSLGAMLAGTQMLQKAQPQPAAAAPRPGLPLIPAGGRPAAPRAMVPPAAASRMPLSLGQLLMRGGSNGV